MVCNDGCGPDDVASVLCAIQTVQLTNCPFTTVLLAAWCSRSGSPSRRDSKRQRSEAAGGSEAAPTSGERGSGAAEGPAGANGAGPAGGGGSGDGLAAMDAEQGGEDDGADDGVELDGEVTAEEIMMMQQMGIPFVSAGCSAARGGCCAA